MGEKVIQAERVIVGHCPDCGRVLVVLNNRETWPYVPCACGWAGATTDIDDAVRLERLMPWERTA